MKPILILLTMIYSLQLRAQSAEDSVKAAVNKLFTGMKNADASLVSNSFSDNAVLQTIAQNNEGRMIVRNEQIKDFADFVAKQKKGQQTKESVLKSLRSKVP